MQPDTRSVGKWGKSLSKRIVLILAAAGLVTLAIGYYARKNYAPRLLVQAQEALAAQQYQKAEDSADRYVAHAGDDYRGWRLLGEAQTHLGKYVQARQSFRRAMGCRPNDLESTLWLGRAYSLPAIEHLDIGSNPSADQTAMFRSAIEDFGQAEVVLSQFKPVRLEEVMAQQTTLGENTANLARAWQGLADRLNCEAAVAQAAGEGDVSSARRALEEPAMQSARQQSARAAKMLLGVLDDLPNMSASKPACKNAQACFSSAAMSLAQLATQRQDQAMLDQAARALEANRRQAPRAWAMLASYQARQACDMQTMEALAESLDELLTLKLPPKSEDLADLRLARAEVALLAGQLSRASELCQATLAALPKYLPARLLAARVLIAQGGYSQAQSDLFVLKAQMPDSVEVKIAYAQAADASGKKDLARNEMHALTCLDPGNAYARSYLCQALMRDGFAESAFEQASAYYRTHPGDSQAVKLFVQTCRLTHRDELAEKALATAGQTTQP